MGSSTRGPGPLTRQCAAPPPRPVRGGGALRGRALPSTRAAAALRRRAAAAGPPCALGRLSSASSAPCTPRCLCCRSPKTCPPRPPPHGVGCPARGRGPGSWRGERAVPHEADECVRTESGGRRPSSARRCRCCGPQPGAAVGGDREGACSRARLCLVRSVGIAPGAGQWTSLLGPRSVSHGDFGGARLVSDCVPVCLGGSACVAWGAVAVSAGVESKRPARAWPGASWSRGPGGRGAANVVLLAGALARLGLSGGGVTPAMFLRSSGCSVAPEFIFGRKSPRRLAAACLGALPEKGADLRLKPRGRAVRDDAARLGAPVRNAATRHRLPAALTRRAPRLARSVGLQPLSVSFALSVDNIHSGRSFLESHGVSLCVLCEVSFEN